MIKSIIEFHAEMLDDSIGMLLFCFLVCIYILVGVAVFSFLDSAMGEAKMMDGRVTGKDHIPGHMVVTNTGKTTITTWIPDSYSVDAYFHEIDKTLTCSVSEDAYEITDYTSSITASISSGYFTDSHYCQ